MGVALRAIGSAIAQVFTHFTVSLLGNLVAALLSLPLAVVIGLIAVGAKSLALLPLGVAFLIGVLPNPCTAGVQAVAHELALGEDAAIHDYRKGLRQYARLSAATWLVSLLVSAIMLINIAFYVRAASSGTAFLHNIAVPLTLLWLLALLIWIAMHLYVFPLLIEQEIKSIRLIYRNAALMVVARPGVALFLVPLWLAIVFLSSVTGLVTIVGLAFSASIQQNATAKLLPGFKTRAEP